MQADPQAQPPHQAATATHGYCAAPLTRRRVRARRQPRLGRGDPVYDLQVFGWATVVALRVSDQATGEALLADDFEAAAWQGKATTSVCHWIRGFLTGALSSLTGHALKVSQPECQAKGDRYSRMVLQSV